MAILTVLNCLHVIEEFIDECEAEIIDNLHWNENLAKNFLLHAVKAAVSEHYSTQALQRKDPMSIRK